MKQLDDEDEPCTCTEHGCTGNCDHKKEPCTCTVHGCTGDCELKKDERLERPLTKEEYPKTRNWMTGIPMDIGDLN